MLLWQLELIQQLLYQLCSENTSNVNFFMLSLTSIIFSFIQKSVTSPQYLSINKILTPMSNLFGGLWRRLDCLVEHEATCLEVESGGYFLFPLFFTFEFRFFVGTKGFRWSSSSGDSISSKFTFSRLIAVAALFFLFCRTAGNGPLALFFLSATFPSLSITASN